MKTRKCMMSYCKLSIIEDRKIRNQIKKSWISIKVYQKRFQRLKLRINNSHRSSMTSKYIKGCLNTLNRCSASFVQCSSHLKSSLIMLRTVIKIDSQGHTFSRYLWVSISLRLLSRKIPQIIELIQNMLSRSTLIIRLGLLIKSIRLSVIFMNS